MGKFLLYTAWVFMLAGAIITRFVYEFSDVVYITYLVICVLLGVLGYFIDKRKNSHK